MHATLHCVHAELHCTHATVHGVRTLNCVRACLHVSMPFYMSCALQGSVPLTLSGVEFGTSGFILVGGSECFPVPSSVYSHTQVRV